jgi:hypothetical protein
MVQTKLPLIALVAAVSLLAGGCYCPLLSGRYGELGYCPPGPWVNPAMTPASPPADGNAPPGAQTPLTAPPVASAPAAPIPAPLAAEAPAPLPAPTKDSKYDNKSVGHPHRLPFPGGLFWLGGRLGSRRAGAPRSWQQGPDYASPQAKFHALPTRPVFEPQLDYPPPDLIEPAGLNPLRPGAIVHNR